MRCCGPVAWLLDLCRRLSGGGEGQIGSHEAHHSGVTCVIPRALKARWDRENQSGSLKKQRFRAFLKSFFFLSLQLSIYSKRPSRHKQEVHAIIVFGDRKAKTHLRLFNELCGYNDIRRLVR